MKLNFEGNDYEVEILGTSGDARVVSVNGTVFAVTVAGSSGQAPSVRPIAPARPKDATPKPEAVATQPAPAPVTVAAGTVAAPMPGTVVSVKVEPGQSVSSGDVLLVLESMKMENDIPAPADGVVKEVLVSAGTQVQRGQGLVAFED